MIGRALAPLLLLALVAPGCRSSVGHVPPPEGGSVAVGPAEALAFQSRAESFYERLIQRRFNALETFNDPFLREHFQTVDRFFDYYASLATDFDEANFEKSRPSRVAVLEFVFEDPTTVRVLVTFTGDDDRPLRPNLVHLVRLDRWERADATWWISPGKL
ncbi:MAG: hypothetical protein QNK04_12455 [Myxococcota bacterium]|nr:hypothetical protein [Myxococcota bacterium]